VSELSGVLQQDLHQSPGRVRHLPKLVKSFDDCSYLFIKFKEQLKSTGHVGIVALNFISCSCLPEMTDNLMTLSVKVLGRGLRGKIEGGYKAGNGEFFLLLVPHQDYSEADFYLDMDRIRQELHRYLAISPEQGESSRLVEGEAFQVTVDGVFLVDREGERADNALFRAFQELFGASAHFPRQQCSERREIEDIIANELITPAFQPIISLQHGSVYAYEALSRVSRPSPLANPELLFAKSVDYGLTAPLEMLCRRKALIRATELGIANRLFLNVCPTLLLANDHERGVTAALLDQLAIRRSAITFEITERTLIEDYDLFRRVLAYYREQGYSIAIDDLGSGYAGLKMLAQLEPNYVKLARFLSSDIDTSSTKQALVEALVFFCNKIGARVIAEGIERPEELTVLMEIGVSFGQGYLLGRPSFDPPASGV
jgi:EAL domain-containing protein (putative c-di-GMP-specific phosphodiesterase class I)